MKLYDIGTRECPPVSWTRSWQHAFQSNHMEFAIPQPVSSFDFLVAPHSIKEGMDSLHCMVLLQSYLRKFCIKPHAFKHAAIKSPLLFTSCTKHLIEALADPGLFQSRLCTGAISVKEQTQTLVLANHHCAQELYRGGEETDKHIHPPNARTHTHSHTHTERERERWRETDRATGRDRDKFTHSRRPTPQPHMHARLQKQTQLTERQAETEGQLQRQRQGHTHAHTKPPKHTCTHACTRTHTHTHTHTQKERERERERDYIRSSNLGLRRCRTATSQKVKAILTN